MYLTRKVGAVFRHQKRWYIVCLGVCACLVYSCWYWTGEVVQTGQPEWVEGRRQLYRPGWRDILHREGDVAAQGCTLPRFEPWGPEINKFALVTPQVTCSNTQPSLLYTSFNTLLFNTTALNTTSHTRSDLACGHRYIQLVDADTYIFLPEQTMSADQVHLSPNYNAVWARCYLKHWTLLDWILPEMALSFLGVQIYTNILIYVPKLPILPKPYPIATQYSVIILVIDALSQLNFKRSFPRTWKVMMSLNGILFKAHNRVGANSYPNVMAMLSGETGGVWAQDMPNRTEMYYIDKERQPLLSYIFRENGYITMHMEDAQNMGDFNRKGVVGFKTPPADIYYRAAFLAIVKANFALLRNRPVGSSDCFACLQEKMQHKYQIPAIHDFIETYKDVPNFAFIHLNEYLHNDLNMAKHYDEDLASMIKSLHNSSALTNTFFMLMGDHGFQRADPPFIFTKQGKTEINMPAFYLVPPEDFSTKHPSKYKNLLENSKVLTTFFDINQMLRDILSLAVKKPVSQIFKGFEGHGKSLFKLLSSRTCEEAEIPEEFCSCTDGVQSLDPETDVLVSLGRSLINDVNSYLKDMNYCEKLTISKLENAIVKRANSKSLLTFQIHVHQTQAIFEAQVICRQKTSDSCAIRLTRLDWYSLTSQCVPDNMQRFSPFCICTD